MAASVKRSWSDANDHLLRVTKHRRVTTPPSLQSQLLLHKVKEDFKIHRASEVPKTKPGEVLIEVQAIGLNPIDWKSAQYGFAIPEFPCVSGREFAGQVIEVNDVNGTGIAVGDRVLSIATDYRDYRKSAFQHYAVASAFNTVKIPTNVDLAHSASIGVAFVTTVLALGVCIGLTFKGGFGEYSLLKTAQAQDVENIPKDVREEVINGVPPQDTPREGDWILIYGASSITGQLAVQLCKQNKLKVVAVVNTVRHGSKLRLLGADMIVDREDLDLAAKEIRASEAASVRFAMDTIGKDTATWCQKLLARPAKGRTTRARRGASREAHLVGLTGLPKELVENVRLHNVPIKLFHENPTLGRTMSSWLTAMLNTGDLKLPDVELLKGGLGSVNAGLERLKRGELSGKRLVVEMEQGLGSNLSVWPPEDGGFCWC